MYLHGIDSTLFFKITEIYNDAGNKSFVIFIKNVVGYI